MSNIQRGALHEHLPLDMPFSLHIYPSFYCNFKCGYCLHSLGQAKLDKMSFKKQYMDFGIYKKAVDDAAAQGWRMKAIIFAGHGEPMLHPDIVEMVAYAKKKGVTDRTEIVTNGSLLTHELSDALINAGLDRLRVSLQGVSADEYREMSGVSIGFENFVEQLRYFYTHKKHTEVYIKIIDVALKQPGDKERFEAIFKPVADTTAVEYAIPFVREINLGTLSGKTKQGGLQRAKICSMPFYMLVVYPNGDVLPCCSTESPVVLGNVEHQSLSYIWGSGLRSEFLLEQLDGVGGIPVCFRCSVPEFGLQDGDYLDEYQEELKKRFIVL